VNPALRSSAAHVFVASVEVPEPSPDDLHHLVRVLRLRDGEVVTVSDGVGAWRVTELAGGALVPRGEVQRVEAPQPCTIAAAIPKGDRLEWMVQKLTEVGVTEIVLVHCARSVVRWDGDRAAKQLARLQRVAREAAVQSRRVWLPTLRGPVPFAEAAMIPGVVLAEPDGQPGIAASAVIIGPEGGFSAEELSLPLARLRLVDTVLRVETAAVVAASALLTTR
jgi:16S rRNA (uracil1498-N3)-methyltransferase